MRVAILAFDDMEILDFAGPIEVFAVASRLDVRRTRAEAPFEIVVVAKDLNPVRSRYGLKIIPDMAMGAYSAAEVLLVPGGLVSMVVRDQETIDWITRIAAEARVVASICTGAFLLARAGLLDGCEATTHWEDLGELGEMFPRVTVVQGQRWVDMGQVVTSAGISSGIDMCLHLVSNLASRELADATARQMEYRWSNETGPGVSDPALGLEVERKK